MTNHRQRPETAQEPGLSQPSCRQAAADSSAAGPAALLQPFGTGLNLPPATAGVDEAGRGCLAGPVVAAAVILPEKYHLPNLTDSKALSPAMREALAPRIKACALAWGIGLVWASRIDSINILQATFEAMSKAVSRLALPPAVLLIDGNKTVPVSVLAAQWQKYSVHPGMALPAQRAIVKGDTSEPAISAASVLAKTCRDQLMCRLASRWPGYGFEKHKGYGTSAHYAALEALGPCPVHRLTFRGVLPVAAEQPRSPSLQTQGSLC